MKCSDGGSIDPRPPHFIDSTAEATDFDTSLRRKLKARFLRQLQPSYAQLGMALQNSQIVEMDRRLATAWESGGNVN